MQRFSFAKIVLLLVGLFFALSVADLILTWLLVERSQGQVIESNPLADWWLASYGWGGLTVFKLAMVLVIGLVTAVLARRRQRVAELVLVFACGAQSAIVISSVFMMQRPETEDDKAIAAATEESDSHVHSYARCLPGNGVAMLLRPAVQRELTLSEAQIRELHELARLRRLLSRDSARLNLDEIYLRLDRLQDKELCFLDGLAPAQLRRLTQIAWQERGPLAWTETTLGAALHLTSEQFETISVILEEARQTHPGVGSGRPKSASEEHALNDRLLALLTPEQRETWEELLGTPFCEGPGAE